MLTSMNKNSDHSPNPLEMNKHHQCPINGHPLTETTNHQSHKEKNLQDSSKLLCQMVADLGVCYRFSTIIYLMGLRTTFSIREITKIMLPKTLPLWSCKNLQTIKTLWYGTHHRSYLSDKTRDNRFKRELKVRKPHLLLKDNSQQKSKIYQVELVPKKMGVEINEIMISPGCHQRKKRRKLPLSSNITTLMVPVQMWTLSRC